MAREQVEGELRRVVELRHPEPHSVLGIHPDGDGIVIRAFRPDAQSINVLPDFGGTIPMEHRYGGVFEARLNGRTDVFGYLLEVKYASGKTYQIRDPYSFLPTLGEMDVYLSNEGRHERIWERLGAHPLHHGGQSGVSFAVWAPEAEGISVVGDFNGWDGRLHAMRRITGSGIWELFVPEVGDGARYKFEIRGHCGARRLKADPFAFRTEAPPLTASVVHDLSRYQWADHAWMAEREKADPYRKPMSIYEVHLGSWRHHVEEGSHRPLTYREAAQALGDYLEQMGFTHVELLPVAEHPFGGSWGYQVSGYYAPTARFGHPDDLRYLIDHLHQRGFGVIVDWVPAHFPKDDHALARFDGTAVYEHEDPRQGAHPDWGTLVFNYGRNEVRNFLIANALFWLQEFHVDGLRVDAVASMLYRDYSRKPGEWVPNRWGGRENEEAISFLKELNSVVKLRAPGALMIAEESTAWPKVSAPTEDGGLGFQFKWNMGWMHDTLKYFQTDPLYRQFHHNQLTFGLLYAYSEHFMLPLSHDEVVHLKGSLYGKMPGDPWQKRANLRALLAWMWSHPGKKLLFMGGEFGQHGEWNHDRSLDWHLLEDPGHRGIQALVAQLNALYRNEPALHEADHDPVGFQWLQADAASVNVLAFLRRPKSEGRPLMCVANFSPLPRHGYRVGLPSGGRGWRSSTRMPANSAARAWATWGRPRPRSRRGTDSPSRRSSRCRRWACSGSHLTPPSYGNRKKVQERALKRLPPPLEPRPQRLTILDVSSGTRLAFGPRDATPMRQFRDDILSVRIATTAWRQLGVVPSNTFARIKATLYQLAENPQAIPQVPDGGAMPGQELVRGLQNASTSSPLCFTVEEFVAMYTVDFEHRLLTLVEVARRLPETG